MEEIKPENILVSYTKEFDKICKNILHEDVTAQHPQLPLVIRVKKTKKMIYIVFLVHQKAGMLFKTHKILWNFSWGNL